MKNIFVGYVNGHLVYRELSGGARTEEQRKAGDKCAGETDSVSLNLIPKQYAIRLLENGHYFCFDVRSLFDWLGSGRNTNPLTGLKFSDLNIQKIKRKFGKAGLIPQVQLSLKEKFDAYWAIYEKYYRLMKKFQNDPANMRYAKDMQVKHELPSTVYQALLRFRSSGYPNEPAWRRVESAALNNLFVQDKIYPEALEEGFRLDIKGLRSKLGD